MKHLIFFLTILILSSCTDICATRYINYTNHYEQNCTCIDLWEDDYFETNSGNGCGGAIYKYKVNCNNMTMKIKVESWNDSIERIQYTYLDNCTNEEVTKEWEHQNIVNN